MIKSFHFTYKNIEDQHKMAIDLGIFDELKKRLDLTEAEFKQIVDNPNKTYRDFQTYRRTFEREKPLFWAMYKLDLAPKSFYMKFTRKYDDE